MKSIIFDMDGVIVDSELDHAMANINALKRYSIDVDYDYVYRFVGTTLTHMVNTIINDFNMNISPEELIQASNEEKYKIIEEKGYRAVEGTVNLIHSLKEKGYRLAIASSSVPNDIKNVTDYFHITDCFDVIVSGTYVQNPKPAPDIFLKAVDDLGTTPSECFVIEDSTVGIAAANSARIPSIGFVNPHSGEQDLSKARHIVTSMNDCLPIILAG